MWVVRGVLESDDAVPFEALTGSDCMPSACAPGVCVKNANGTSPAPFVLVGFAGEVDALGSCFGCGEGWSKERSFWICASLRAFSARRA